MSKPTVKIKFTGSYCKCTEKQKGNLRGLGLTKREMIRELEDTPAVRGMINKVNHLVKVLD